MLNYINKIKSFNADELILFLFPLAVLFKSAALNFYIIFCGLYFLKKIINKKCVIKLSYNDWIFFVIIFFVYNIIISFSSIDQSASFIRTFSILKFLLLSLFIFTVNLRDRNIEILIELISFVLLLVCIDTFIQFFVGKDLLGYEVFLMGRLSGPFGDELIVGAYLTFLSIPIISYFLENFKSKNKKKKIYYLLFIILIYLTVLISGERMNFIILTISYVLILFNKSNYKKLIFFVSSFLLIFSITLFLNEQLRSKYNSFYEDISDFKNSNHGKLLYSAIEIWGENKFTGVGLKNYRYACDNDKINNITNQKNLCSTHPHNLYFEILVETGIIGLTIFLIFIFLIFKKILNSYFETKFEYKPIIYGSLIIIFFYFWPLRSNGSFFSTFNGSFFWFNLGIILLLSNNKRNKIEK